MNSVLLDPESKNIIEPKSTKVMEKINTSLYSDVGGTPSDCGCCQSPDVLPVKIIIDHKAYYAYFTPIGKTSWEYKDKLLMEGKDSEEVYNLTNLHDVNINKLIDLINIIV
jgi:hypothetical protein